MKKAISTVMVHILFWIAVWFFFYYFFSYNSADKGYVIWFSSLLLPITAAVTYFSIYYLLPKHLYTRQYGKLLLFSFYTLVASSYFIVLTIYGCMIIYKKFDASNIPPMVKNFFFILILVYLVVGLVSFITILNRSLKTEKLNRELQHKMLTAQLQFKEQELYYLKKQIHPHFLFNTLNTIYGLSLKRSGDTPDVILKLSNLLDYILYQVDKPRVSLQEEVMHIKEYIDLEKIRFQDSLDVEFQASEIDNHIQIAPMLMIPLVENAFKHGRISDGILKIKLHIVVEKHSMEFTIRNSVLEAEIGEERNGIGLENFMKRLDIHYRDNYKLEKYVEKGWYTARLFIPDLINTNNE